MKLINTWWIKSSGTIRKTPTQNRHTHSTFDTGHKSMTIILQFLRKTISSTWQNTCSLLWIWYELQFLWIQWYPPINTSKDKLHVDARKIYEIEALKWNQSKFLPGDYRKLPNRISIICSSPAVNKNLLDLRWAWIYEMYDQQHWSSRLRLALSSGQLLINNFYCNQSLAE